MTLSIIVALANNNVIGGGNTLLWKLPADFKHFKEITMGHPIIMGRKTYLSIGRALPERTNIIVTRQTNFTATGCIITHSLEDALAIATKSKNTSDEVFCIGGGELYQQALPLAQKLYVTHVHATFEGDTYFPAINPTEWQEIAREPHRADEKNQYPFEFISFKSLREDRT